MDEETRGHRPRRGRNPAQRPFPGPLKLVDGLAVVLGDPVRQVPHRDAPHQKQDRAGDLAPRAHHQLGHEQLAPEIHHDGQFGLWKVAPTPCGPVGNSVSVGHASQSAEIRGEAALPRGSSTLGAMGTPDVRPPTATGPTATAPPAASSYRAPPEW